MSRLAKPPLEVAELAEILKTKYWQRLFCYSCKNLALSQKHDLCYLSEKKIKSVFQFDLIEKM